MSAKGGTWSFEKSPSRVVLFCKPLFHVRFHIHFYMKTNHPGGYTILSRSGDVRQLMNNLFRQNENDCNWIVKYPIANTNTPLLSICYVDIGRVSPQSHILHIHIDYKLWKTALAQTRYGLSELKKMGWL